MRPDIVGVECPLAELGGGLIDGGHGDGTSFRPMRFAPNADWAGREHQTDVSVQGVFQRYKGAAEK